MTDRDEINEARDAYIAAHQRLTDAIEDKCPSGHYVIQHRDGRPAWCPHCRRTADGWTVDELDQLRRSH